MTSSPPSTPKTGQKTGPKFYGRRKGKPLRPGREALVEQALPALAIERPDPDSHLDPISLFPDGPKELWLEVGCGAGEHVAQLAADNPDIGIIASEVFLNGIASLLSHIAARNLNNIRIYPEDVRHILPALRGASLDRIYVMFPDPWPKTRHAKRRFIGPGNLDTLARVIRPGGLLVVASDHPVYVTWALGHLTRHPAFTWTATRPSDWLTRPPGTIETRYAAKAVREGRQPVYLVFERTAD